MEAGTLGNGHGDAQAIIDTALAAAEPDELDPQKVYEVTVPEGGRHELLDLERFLAAPRRKRGTVTVATVQSFVDYVKAHESDETTVWVHPTSGAIVAVLNDHGQEAAAWGDHRAALALLQTDEWQHWMRRDGELGGQQEFAEHIEDGTTEIVSPDAATMLELAQSFHAHTNASFRQASRLSDGAVSMLYDENIEAKAGQRGELQVPSEFTLAIAPFVGEKAYELKARLRYRIGGGHLRIGYKLERPNEVVRDALQRITDRLDEQFSAVYSGEPRGARS